jgi:hypothetical protein
VAASRRCNRTDPGNLPGLKQRTSSKAYIPVYATYAPPASTARRPSVERLQFKGDYGTPEQQIPATGFGEGVSWESCMTMNGTWGFKADDHKWKSTETLVQNLIDIASKGGNYLLNILPNSPFFANEGFFFVDSRNFGVC